MTCACDHKLGVLIWYVWLYVWYSEVVVINGISPGIVKVSNYLVFVQFSMFTSDALRVQGVALDLYYISDDNVCAEITIWQLQVYWYYY